MLSAHQKGQKMRVVIVAPPPWATSGYGKQCKLAALALAGSGHDIAVLAYAGVHEEADWHGIRILSNGGAPYANGTIAASCKRWRADVVILLCDMWTIDPAQLTGLTVMPWLPIDTEQLGIMDRQWLTTVNRIADLWPVAMSEHARRLLAAFGLDAVLVPHATTFAPDAAAGLAWRAAHNITPAHFLVLKVGVNNEDDRKAFGVTLQAFADFSAKHKQTALFCHTEPQARKAPNLVYMSVSLRLQGKIAFPDEDMRRCDLHDDHWMRAMYCAADVLDVATKGEGFGVPAIEALACGTPVIGCRNSAMTEKIQPEFGWLVRGQRTWARHHNAWWSEPDAAELARAYGKARTSARSMRRTAARAGEQWSVANMTMAWEQALAQL